MSIENVFVVVFAVTLFTSRFVSLSTATKIVPGTEPWIVAKPVPVLPPPESLEPPPPPQAARTMEIVKANRR